MCNINERLCYSSPFSSTEVCFIVYCSVLCDILLLVLSAWFSAREVEEENLLSFTADSLV